MWPQETSRLQFTSSTVTHHLEWLEKWTKILTLEITIFGLKMMVKSGLEKIILKFHVPLRPLELLLPSAEKTARKGRIGLAG